MANKVHVVLMNKGGVGKTFVAIKLAQYLADHHTVPAASTPIRPHPYSRDFAP